ncbi:Late Golgi vesicles protein [Saitozyma podzolica]|uniref:Late Golgi vesicles protein n=1 Tax=Saitozyma podzolica TaxID=1890683 RepID=A0A427YRZ2_9TREE|nr:Late Golgi vesicles protein [Saitozyma podzolica]
MERFTQNPTELLRLVNMGVGGVAIAGGVGSLIHHSFSSIIIGIYEVLRNADAVCFPHRPSTDPHLVYTSHLVNTRPLPPLCPPHHSAGAVIIFLEARTPTEEHKALVHKYASFMHSFVGRGVFYLLLGVLMLNYYTILYVCGSIVGFAGLVYIALNFVPLVEAPSTMQAPVTDAEAQPVWQGPTE